MDTIQGYEVGKRLQSGRASELRAGVRRSDALEVVLKTYAGEDSDHSDAEHEFDALRRSAGAAVVRALDLVRAPGQVTLVLSRAPGISLAARVERDGPLPIPACLAIGGQIASALGRAHAAHLVHRNLSPDHVFVELPTIATELVGFGMARKLGASSERRSHGKLPRDLHYISPEQTGRMDRGVDSRSDLYSLGATLYFALTGQPPFAGDDPLGLIHAHLARLARPVREVRPQVPLTLSRLVMRLLEKSPDDRYQHAASVRTDLLRCERELAATGVISDDLPLGIGDAPHRPQFANRLHGREADVRTLEDAFRAATSGSAVAVVLRGGAGIGKSALVDTLRLPITRARGHLAVGKFDPYRRDQPNLGIAEALRDLACQLLTESDRQLERWRSELLDALGPTAPVVAELAPEFRLVLGDVAPAPQLGPVETRLRLGLALQRLVGVVATRQHPLVLFLDDLQWADASSRDLLTDAIRSPKHPALLLVCAVRTDAIAGSEPALAETFESLRLRGVRVTEIELAPLGEQACVEMLGEALARSPEHTATLARCVARKTGNVPFAIQQFIHHMHGEGHIRFVADVGWSWDDAEIEAAQIPESAVGLLTTKIARLPTSVAAVLGQASLLGSTLDPGLLVDLGVGSGAEVEAALYALAHEGLIAPSANGFTFSHDRIREAAQARLTPSDRADVHARAAAALLARTPEQEMDDRVFEIADHLREAGTASLGHVDSARCFTVYARACGQALQAGAGDAAWHYFSAAEARCDDDQWDRQPLVCAQLFLDGSDAAHQCERFDQVERCLRTLLARPLVPLQRIQVHARQIRTSSVTKPRPQTVALSLALLAQGGVHFTARPSRLRVWWDVLLTDWRLRGPLDAEQFVPCSVERIEEVCVVLLFQAAGQSLSMTSHRLVLRAAAFVLRAYQRCGYLISPSFALAAYAAYRMRFTGSVRPSLRFAAAAKAWNDRVHNPVYAAQSRTILLAYVDAWMKPRYELLEPLRRVAEGAADAGEFEYACLSDALRTTLMATIGVPIRQFAEAVEQMNWSRWSYAMSLPYTISAQLYSTLRVAGDLDEVLSEVSAVHVATRDLYLYISIHVMTVRLVLGECDEVFDESERVYEPMFCAQMGTHIADFVFLRGLAAGAVARTSIGRRRRAARRALRSASRSMRRWARPGSDFEHMLELLDSEHHWLRGDFHEALVGYERGARSARDHGHRHHAALALERRGDLLLAMRRATEGQANLRQSAALYEEWGAAVKAAALVGRLAREG